MAFRGRGSGRGAAPKGYIPGLGRGAAGFTTRSDVGPMAAPGTLGDDDNDIAGAVGGSRSAELRAAKMSMKASSSAVPAAGPVGMFGAAPQGYVPGAGRGAGLSTTAGDDDGPTGTFDSFGGYVSSDPRNQLAEEAQYDEDDDEADKIWAAIDEKMNNKRKRKTGSQQQFQDAEDEPPSSRSKIGVQFRELKEKLADVTEDQWASIPDVGDYSLKFKQK